MAEARSQVAGTGKGPCPQGGRVGGGKDAVVERLCGGVRGFMKTVRQALLFTPD